VEDKDEEKGIGRNGEVLEREGGRRGERGRGEGERGGGAE
jgi:hypothetical protein